MKARTDNRASEGVARPSRRAYWTLQALGWGAYALSNHLMFFIVPWRGWGRFTAIVLLPALAGFLLSHAYRAFIRARGWKRCAPLALAPRIIVASLVQGLGLLLVQEAGLLTLTENRETMSIMWHIHAMTLYFFSIPFFGWSLIYFAYHYAARAREAEVAWWRTAAEARAAEMDTLRSQLNPHFLFNALNSVRALIAEEPARAQRAVTRLSEMLRYSLQRSDVATVALRAEMEMVENYLALEAMRLEERLRYRVEADPAALEASVLPMLVQTLVENAVKHGVARQPGGGALAVEARRHADRLRVRVVNTGALAGASDPEGAGVGLRNARARLRLLYGEAASLMLTDTGRGEVIAELDLPAHPARNGQRLSAA